MKELKVILESFIDCNRCCERFTTNEPLCGHLSDTYIWPNRAKKINQFRENIKLKIDEGWRKRRQEAFIRRVKHNETMRRIKRRHLLEQQQINLRTAAD